MKNEALVTKLLSKIKDQVVGFMQRRTVAWVGVVKPWLIAFLEAYIKVLLAKFNNSASGSRNRAQKPVPLEEDKLVPKLEENAHGG